MAATKTRNYLLALAERKLLDFDPNSTAATLVDLVPGAAATCLPIADAHAFLFGVLHSVGSTDISPVEVIAATSNTGAGATVVLSKSTADKDIDAVGDYLWLEVDVAMIREVLPTATHVGLRITQATLGDECVVYYEKWGRHQYRSLTADYAA